jgi:TonB family protein
MSSPFWTSQRTVVFSALREMFTDTNITFNTFLTNLGNLTIPSVVGLASIQTGIVTFSDAVYAGYKVSRGRYSYNPAFVPEPSDADCAILTKTGVDARDVHKYCLVNVNGLIHRVDADSKYAYILDAAKSANYCKRNEIGIMSFAKIGALECVTLTEDCIGRMHPNQPMSNQISIKSPVDPKGRVAALGMSALMDFIRKNLNYDKSLVPETVVIPRVIVQFVIDEEGNIIHPVVLRGVNPALDEEALRVVKLMPKWKPGRQSGKPEKVRYAIPVTFERAAKVS